MKNIITPLLCIIFLFFVIINQNKIINYATNFFSEKKDITISENGPYFQGNNYAYVQNTKNFEPLGYQDLLNIFYTVIDNRIEKFTFYCPSEYDNCIDDLMKISDSSLTLSNINNFVHPYNSFTNIKTLVDTNGEVVINISYLYTDEQINYIDQEVKKIIKENTDTYQSLETNIKSIHDYLVKRISYDTNYKNNKHLYTFNAYGALKQNVTTCNGYTDLMAIILTYLDVKNYKIAYNPENASEDNLGHVWNAVKINNEWLHLDLTWDDPTNGSQDYINHDYFLVSTDEMISKDSGQIKVNEHNFDNKVYQEFR